MRDARGLMATGEPMKLKKSSELKCTERKISFKRAGAKWLAHIIR